MVVDETWRIDLERWLAPFLAELSHPARRRMCPLYIAGLIGPGDRKSVQPMTARAGDVGYDQLHHFVAAGAWDSVPLEAALLKEANRLVGDQAGFLAIEDTALPKKGHTATDYRCGDAEVHQSAAAAQLQAGFDIAIPSFGCNSSIAICRRFGFIRCGKVSDGARFDGRMLRDVVARDNTAPDVWADTVYRSRSNEAWLRSTDRVRRIHRRNLGVSPCPHAQRAPTLPNSLSALGSSTSSRGRRTKWRYSPAPSASRVQRRRSRSLTSSTTSTA